MSRLDSYDHADPRVMMHTRVAGDPATQLAVN